MLVIDESKSVTHEQLEAVEAQVDAETRREANKPKPDPIVKEREIRRALGAVVEGLSKQARDMGMLPNISAATQWATPIVMETVKRHEENFGKAKSSPVEKSPSRLDRGDVDGEVVNRPLGTVVLGAPGAGATPLTGQLAKPQKPQDPLLKARVDMLLQLPEWAAKIHKAFDEGMARWGDQSRACDDVMAIVESSCNLFGDWRTPKQRAAPIYIGGL